MKRSIQCVFLKGKLGNHVGVGWARSWDGWAGLSIGWDAGKTLLSWRKVMGKNREGRWLRVKEDVSKLYTQWTVEWLGVETGLGCKTRKAKHYDVLLMSWLWKGWSIQWFLFMMYFNNLDGRRHTMASLWFKNFIYLFIFKLTQHMPNLPGQLPSLATLLVCCQANRVVN